MKKFGFTLIELLVVIIILGILVSIGMPLYMHSVEAAKCTQAMSVLTTLRTAELDYFRENDVFTAQIDDLRTQVGAAFADTKDWQFSVSSIGVATFSVQAQRLGGPHGAGKTIMLDELENWSGTYPYNTPRVW